MFANIVLSGGGLAAIAYLGCLQYLQSNREVKNTLKNVLGVSSGAIFALILVLDLSYEETKNWLQGLSEVRINHIHIHSIKTLMEKYGLDEGVGVVELVNSLFSLRNLDENITFRDLAKRFGKNLIVAAANVHTSDIEYFSIDTTPNMGVIQAIRASTAIPLLFTPVLYNEHYFVDAFIYDNFPLNYFKNDQHTLGLNLVSKQTMVSSCAEFFTKMFYSVIKNHSFKKHANECIIECSSNGFNIKRMSFDIDESQFDTIVADAYATLSEFIANRREKIKQTFESEAHNLNL